MPCKFAVACNDAMCACEKGLFGGKPSHGTCVRCVLNTDRPYHEKMVAVMLEISAKRNPQRVQQPKPGFGVMPIPYDDWGVFLRGLSRNRKPGESGLGDTIHRLIPKSDELIAKLKSWGIDCGCANRRAWLNARYPYATTADNRTP